jgi:hypothetical protein
VLYPLSYRRMEPSERVSLLDRSGSLRARRPVRTETSVPAARTGRSPQLKPTAPYSLPFRTTAPICIEDTEVFTIQAL